MAKFKLRRVQQTRPGAASHSIARTNLLSGPEKRRGVRLNSQVPVVVEWDAGGKIHRGEAHTRVVGPYGCLVVLQQDLEVDQHVQVINLASSQANPAVIVWRGHERAEGWELGIELINPEMNFWGLDL